MNIDQIAMHYLSMDLFQRALQTNGIFFSNFNLIFSKIDFFFKKVEIEFRLVLMSLSFVNISPTVVTDTSSLS